MTKSTREWLIGFEKAAGQPVVVTLVVQRGVVRFYSCVSKRAALHDDEDEDDGPPGVNLARINRDRLSLKGAYIG